MKDKVFMSPNNAALVIGIPLFRISHTEEIATIDGYLCAFNTMTPMAYVIDIGSHAQVMSAEFVENNLIELGEL